MTGRRIVVRVEVGYRGDNASKTIFVNKICMQKLGTHTIVSYDLQVLLFWQPVI